MKITYRKKLEELEVEVTVEETAYAAADAAAHAARAADAAARAADAADAATYFAAYKKMSKKLLQLLHEAPVS